MKPFAIAFGIVWWVLSVYGVSNAVAELKFGDVIRGPKDSPARLGRIPWLGEMLGCIACTAMWVGAAFSWLLWSPSQALAMADGPWDALLTDGAAASGIVWLIHVVSLRIEGVEGK